MGLISKPNTFTAGATIVASEHNDNFDTVYNLVNGNIENANIKAAAGIIGSKLDLSEPGAIGGTTAAAGSFTTVTTSSTVTVGGSVISDTDDTDDLGSAAKEFKDLYIDGTANIDSLVADTADINGGTVDGANVGATTPGTGKFTTLTVGTANQGDIWYDDGTDFHRLTPGTSGQFLQTQGAAANPQWANQDLSLTSVTTMTSATTSSDITIAKDKLYKIIVVLTASGVTDVTNIRLRFNSDSGASDYLTGAGTDDGIDLMPPDAVSNSDRFTAEFLLDTNELAGCRARVTGSYVYANGGELNSGQIAGEYTDSEVTSFEINTTNDATAKIYLYTYALS